MVFSRSSFFCCGNSPTGTENACVPDVLHTHSQRLRRGIITNARVFSTVLVICAVLLPQSSRAEAMLQLFQVNWTDLTQKIPEIAEAGYTSLWLPPPSKGMSVFSVGYDSFDPFDLGDKNQRGTTRTKYGTKAELLQMVEMAHRFGLRVYFDNIMNHRGNDVPGYNSNVPTNLYPGLVPADFHLQTVSGGFYRNWPSISDWNNVWQIQHQPLLGLVDLATESGSINENFGNTLGSTIAKPVFVRHPGIPSYYMDTNLPAIAGSWYPFNGANGDPKLEDVNSYLIRAALWTLNETKCDGFRLDAVKHVPSSFFGDTSATANGYTGAIQTMFDYVHGYGNNVTGNGYTEGDDNRNSCFNTEATRNDALIFGEHQGQPPSYSEYTARGMRLVDSPLRDNLNGRLGNPSSNLNGLDQRDSGGFSANERVMYAQSHDNDFSNHRELQLAYMFMREGLPCIYSDGYNNASGNPPFPRIPNAPYLGQFGDNKMPDVAYLHHQLARGGTRPRWSDADIVAFERYDYREVSGDAFNDPASTVVLFAMNDNFSGTSGDISFDDGVSQTTAGTFYECFPASNSRGRGMVVGFPPGSVLVQLADSPNKNRACSKLLVRQATASLSEAQATKDDPDPVKRKVYVGSATLFNGGGAIEFKIPSGGYVCYGYQWPEPSRASLSDAITVQQGGANVPRITLFRRDGVNGDFNFNPRYPFKNRGSVDAFGDVITGANFSNKTYTIDVPIVTNGVLDVLVRCDASATNALVKLDGGVDLNSQLGLGPMGNPERRDNRPGAATDVFLGYEQTLLASRFGPEKFAAADTNRCNTVSLGAETFHYFVDSTNKIVSGSGYDVTVTNSTAAWALHDPGNGVTVAGGGPATMRVPFNPTNGGPVEIWVKVGFQSQINCCTIYYTTDGTNPEGAFGVGTGTTKTIAASFTGNDATNPSVGWWKGTIPANDNAAGAQIRYKVALYNNDISTISDKFDAKTFGCSEFVITNFNPETATVWLHNDRNTNSTVVGLSEGLHIFRARCFLPRPGKSSVFNTFSQTFYYDASPPTGVIAFPVNDGVTLTNATYQFVVRGDSTVTGVEFNIADSSSENDDALTGQDNGNGETNGVSKFAAATQVTPDAALNALYPSYPREFRFTYAAIPTDGVATITVRLKEAVTSVLPTRFGTLTRTLNTAAPFQTVFISDPPSDGLTLTLQTNDVYTLRACFSQALTPNNIDLFSIFINGEFQPRRSENGTPLYSISPFGCGTGLRQLSYDWANAPVGSNFIQVIFTNTLVLSDSRSVQVARPVEITPPRISGLSDNNQLIVWESVSNVNYQVLATTNLNIPMQPISPVIPASGESSFFFDEFPDPTNKFYRIQIVP